MPDEAEVLYGDALDAMGAAAAKAGARGFHPDRAAKAIEHALTARRPRTRYLIGRDAKGMVGLSTVLPTRAYDALLERGMGLPRRAPDAD